MLKKSSFIILINSTLPLPRKISGDAHDCLVYTQCADLFLEMQHDERIRDEIDLS